MSAAYKYEGEWEQDKEEGQGAAQWDSGEKYVGERTLAAHCMLALASC